MSNLGKQVRLFLADGSPGGILTAEIINWTGHIVSASRSDITALLARKEVSKTGVYILIGSDTNSVSGLQVYIGEADNISTRLKTHAKTESLGGKDFWDKVIVVTSKDENLTKAHARYLESRLISIATLADRASLVNSTRPDAINLPEADESDMEYFIEQVKIVLPLVGVNIFRVTKTATHITYTPAKIMPQDLVTTNTEEFEVFVNKIDRKNPKKARFKARMLEIDGEYVVQKGSYARAKWTGPRGGYETMREKLEADGSLINDPAGSGLKIFTRDCVFSSPSGASSAVFGRTSNGRVEWKLAGTNGAVSLSDYEQSELN